MPPFETDPDLLAKYREDAAHYPGGHTPAVVRPQTPQEVAELLAGTGTGSRVLTVGAQSSLTGGATPFGDLVLSTERLTGLEMKGDRIRAGAGVTLQAVQDALAAVGRWLPPVPT